MNSQGGYDASVPLDLPEARGGLPVPLRISYGDNKVGAAGLGWDVALSYIFVDTSIAHHRPIGSPNAAPQARERVFLVLDGQRIDLVRSTTANTWLARRNGAQLEVRDRGDGVMSMYDGEGRTYMFSSQGGAAGTRLVGGRLFLLNGISAPGGNTAVFHYQFNAPALPGGGNGLAIDLFRVWFNKSPTKERCYKNSVLLSYDLQAPAPLSISMLGATPLVRVRKIAKVTVFSRPSCAEPDVPLRTYIFNYELDPDTQLPRLQSVRMNGQRRTPEEHVSLPVAAYTYGTATGVDGRFTYRKTPSIPLPPPLLTTPGISISGERPGVEFEPARNVTSRDFIDLNGDGRPDLTYYQGGGGGGLHMAHNTPGTGGSTTFSAVDTNLSSGANLNLYALEERKVTSPRQVAAGNTPISEMWHQTIDVNGDGRLDMIEAQERLRAWVMYLNVPDPVDPNRVAWVRRAIPIAPVIQQLRAAGHLVITDDLLPLGRVSTAHDTLYNQCWEWKKGANNIFSWVLSLGGYSGPLHNRCNLPQGQDPSRDDFDGHDLADKTITEWELRDINGDGYPDFVYNASRVGFRILGTDPPSQPGSFEGQFLETQKASLHDLMGSRDVRALLNVAGVHLDMGKEVFPGDGNEAYLESGTELFSAPITLEVGGPQGCGVSRWQDELASTAGRRIQVCGFDDVNGDGLADRLTYVVKSTPTTTILVGKASPGTGDLNALFSADASILLPGPIARVESDLVYDADIENFKPRACPAEPTQDPNLPGFPVDTFPIQRTAALSDINGDGIPDYIAGDTSTAPTSWTVAIGTGAAFAPARPVVSAVGLELSLEVVGCFAENTSAATTRGLYDVDGDGRPEVIVLNDGSLEVYQLNAAQDPQHPFEGNVPSSPTEGRLVMVENGYGAITHIDYRSAKEDPYTHHLVPFPEIVITAIGTKDSSGSPLLSPIRYAYGGAELIFDSAVDAFRFPGYRRSVEHRITTERFFPSPTDGVATITDSYRLAPFVPSMDANARFKRYLKAGRVSDSTVISGNIGTDPWALLSTNIDNDARRIGGAHYDWNTRLLPAGPSDSEVCLDMVFPYDFQQSSVNSLGLDQCTQRGFVFQTIALSWRGTPGTASPLATDATVLTDTEVLSVDDFGRVTSVAEFNDLFRADDNLCIQTVYATPTGTKERVLSAPASRTITNCPTPTVPLATYGKDIWEYDTSPGGVKLPPGKVSNGFVTGHIVSRLDLETGASLGDIRVFDATYDPASGRLRTVKEKRDDGARQTQARAYDRFGLAPVSVRIDATNANGTRLPSLQTDISRDPITLNALTTTDANGTQAGNTFDGFGRVLLSTVNPPGGTAGALSSMSYLGFAVGDTAGRRIVHKVFTDPVAAAIVGTATGRASTVFLDQIGRELRTEVAMGTDYANQTLVIGYRSYDQLGRVRFEADPYLSTARTSYGTTYHFNTDGTPSCVIRGHWQQPLTKITDEANERYPTCFSRSFSNNEEVVHTRDAASLLAGSPQAGVVEESISDANGQVLSRSTYKAGFDAPLERATFRYDALGNLSSMTRYQDSASTAKVTTSWRYDSLGQVLELHEPDSATLFHSYDNWGELTQVQWLDTTTSPATDRRLVTRYDALGRVVHNEDRTNDVVDAATVHDYLYDEPVHVTTPPVLATNVRGRLAKATFPTGSVSLSYDGLGRVNTQTFTDSSAIPGGVYVQKHGYHGDGSLSALDLLLPDTGFATEHVDYTYDSAGRIRSVTYSDGAISQNVFSAAGSTDIDPLGRIRQAQFGSATYTADYADTGRRLLKSVRVASPSLGSSREISYPNIRGSVTAYDPLGRERSRREFKDETAAPALVTTYDALGRLAASSLFDVDTDTLSVQRQFTYDPLGNILKQDDLSSTTATGAVHLTYETKDRDRICSIGYGVAAPSPACNVKYDGIGNITSHPTRNGTRSLRYFANGQVKEITDGNGTHAIFHYDAAGAVQQLVLKGNTPDTRHDQHFGSLIAKRDEVVAGTRKSVLMRSIPGPGVVATRHGPAATPSATWTFSFGDQRGNRFFTDQNGAFVQDVEYQPYGEATSTGAQPGAPTYTSAQWNGGDALAAFGLSQLGARIYDPVIGRFLSRDPLIIPRTASTTNPYAFAMNDPVNGADPSGLDTFDDMVREEGSDLCPECCCHDVYRVEGRAPRIFDFALDDLFDPGFDMDEEIYAMTDELWEVDRDLSPFDRDWYGIKGTTEHAERMRTWHDVADAMTEEMMMFGPGPNFGRGRGRRTGSQFIREHHGTPVKTSPDRTLPDVWASSRPDGGLFDCTAAVCARSIRAKDKRVRTADDVLAGANLTQEQLNNWQGLASQGIRDLFRANGKRLGREVTSLHNVGDYLVSIEGHVLYGTSDGKGILY